MSAVMQIIAMLESTALKKPDDHNKTLEEQDTAKKTSEEQDTAKKTSEERDTDKNAPKYDLSASKHLISEIFLGLPDEIFLKIGSNLSAADNGRIRLVNKKLNHPFRESFFKALANEYTIYPRYESFHDLYLLLGSGVIKARHVKRIVVVQDGLVAPMYDYDWYWERLEEAMGSNFTNADWKIIYDINEAHSRDVDDNGSFLTEGWYRDTLTSLFMELPNLETIEVRHLHVGEHLPGWDGPDLMKKLSLYDDGLYSQSNYRNMFYGGWQYDEIQKRVTEYVDETGEWVTEPGAGPQADFTVDLDIAHFESDTQAAIVY